MIPILKGPLVLLTSLNSHDEPFIKRPFFFDMKRLLWCRVYRSHLNNEAGRFGKAFAHDCIALCCMLNESATPGYVTMPVEQWQYELQQTPEELTRFFSTLQNQEFHKNHFLDFEVKFFRDNEIEYLAVRTQRIIAEEKDRERKRVTKDARKIHGNSEEIPRKIPGESVGKSDTELRVKSSEVREKSKESSSKQRSRVNTSSAAPTLLLDDESMQRYYHPEKTDDEDRSVVREVFTHLLTYRDGIKPRTPGKQKSIIQALNKYDFEQVVLACFVALEKEVFTSGDISWPFDRYFLGMVRKDAGGWNKIKAREEIANEQSRQRNRIQTQNPLAGNPGNGKGPERIGESLLRNVLKM